MFKDDDSLDHEEKCIIEKETLFSLIYPNTFIGLLSSNSRESFYVVKVVSKGVAEENLSDKYGHTVLAGEEYVSVFEGKDSVKFSLEISPLLK